VEVPSEKPTGHPAHQNPDRHSPIARRNLFAENRMDREERRERHEPKNEGYKDSKTFPDKHVQASLNFDQLAAPMGVYSSGSKRFRLNSGSALR
jgi:hypothetical protein